MSLSLRLRSHPCRISCPDAGHPVLTAGEHVAVRQRHTPPDATAVQHRLLASQTVVLLLPDFQALVIPAAEHVLAVLRERHIEDESAVTIERSDRDPIQCPQFHRGVVGAGREARGVNGEGPDDVRVRLFNRVDALLASPDLDSLGLTPGDHLAGWQRRHTHCVVPRSKSVLDQPGLQVPDPGCSVPGPRNQLHPGLLHAADWALVPLELQHRAPFGIHSIDGLVLRP
mmetsp:Transcript_8148/g.19442  ORF Transcript_8148/g.19442 Transcript_8148/m.19442 type:complete len:228 (+) Transcript_8148:1582-2265(+)